MTLIQFDRPFLTTRIRIRPVEWFDSDGRRYNVQYICQGVALYGCTESDGKELDIHNIDIRILKKLSRRSPS